MMLWFVVVGDEVSTHHVEFEVAERGRGYWMKTETVTGDSVLGRPRVVYGLREGFRECPDCTTVIGRVVIIPVLLAEFKLDASIVFGVILRAPAWVKNAETIPKHYCSHTQVADSRIVSVPVWLSVVPHGWNLPPRLQKVC